jgi:hypothetical protein
MAKRKNTLASLLGGGSGTRDYSRAEKSEDSPQSSITVLRGANDAGMAEQPRLVIEPGHL